MAKTTTTRKTASKTEEVPVAAAPVVAEDTVKKPKKVSKKVVKEPVTEEPKLEEDVSDVEGDATPALTPGGSKRLVPTKDSVLDSFQEVIDSIEAEINRLKQSSTKSKGVKFLRSLNKKLKTLRNQSVRVLKQRQRTNRKNNNNSGFLKPVQISQEMAKFTGWNADELKSRVDVTKMICAYIRDNNLQNPADKRQILADTKLSKLLNYDSKKSEPLTYYRIQSYIKPHFVSSTEVKTPA